MALTETQQIEQLLQEKTNFLITFRKDWSGDSLGSALAVALFLEKRGKRAEIVCDDFALPSPYKFLKHAGSVKSKLSHLRKFILMIDTKETGLESLTYDVADGMLRIFVTPEKGTLSRNMVRTAQSDFGYDCIIVVDSPDLKSLGSIYDDNTELFYRTPIVNIDHQPSNERFGALQQIDVTATTTAEVVYGILHAIGDIEIDEGIATALLTGIIAKTRSFKNTATRPPLLTLASTLIALGANRDNIVQHLFRTRTIATLKLWGQTLRHLQSNRRYGLVWSTITRDDFARTGATEDDLADIVDELIGNSPEANIIVLLHEHRSAATQVVRGMIKSDKAVDVKTLMARYSPLGDANRATFAIAGKGIKDVEEEVIRHLEEQLSARSQ